MKPKLLASAYTQFRSELEIAEQRLAQLQSQMGPTHEDGGGWHDNSAFDQLKTDERNVSAKAAELRTFLADCEIAELKAVYSKVEVGCRVTVKELAPSRFDLSGEYLIIGDRRPPLIDLAEDSSLPSPISTDSPLGKLLTGGRCGEERRGQIGGRMVRIAIVSLG